MVLFQRGYLLAAGINFSYKYGKGPQNDNITIQ